MTFLDANFSPETIPTAVSPMAGNCGRTYPYHLTVTVRSITLSDAAIVVTVILKNCSEYDYSWQSEACVMGDR